jgi:hypothetical protein
MKKHSDNLDMMLSRRLKSAVGEDGVANWFDVRRRAGESDAPVRWPRRRVLLVAALIVLAVAACAGSTGLIPWLGRKPAVSISPPLAPACKAKDIRAALQTGLQYETGDSRDGWIRLTNINRRPCSLTGRPRLVFTGAAARSVRVSITSKKFRVDRHDRMRLLHPASLRALRRGDAAVAYITWASWCGPGSRTPTPGDLREEPMYRLIRRQSGAVPDGLAVILRDGNRIVIPLPVKPVTVPPANPDKMTAHFPKVHAPAAPGCYGKPGSAALLVLGFEAESRSKPRTAQLPLRATIPGVKLVDGQLVGSRYHVRQGAVLRYVVALTNTSKRPFRFRTCPLYDEGIMYMSQFSATAPIQQRNAIIPRTTYVLNCRQVGTIAPGATVRFAMELPIPENAFLGKGELYWKLSYPFEGDSTPTPYGTLIGAVARVEVVK